MEENGQTYFYSTDDVIPEANRNRYLESLREEEALVHARLEKKLQEREAFDAALREAVKPFEADLRDLADG